MRTTVNLDEDILEASRAIARVEGRPLGSVLSGLARKALAPQRPRVADQDGFPVFEVEPGTRAITDKMVRAAQEDL